MKIFFIFLALVQFSFCFGLNFQDVYHNFLGKKAYEKGNFSQAREKFSQLVVGNTKKDGRANFNLGDSYYKEKDYDKAIAQYNISLLDKDFVSKSFAQQNIGNSYFRQGKMEMAKKAYIEAIKEDPNNYQARLNLELAQKALQKQNKQQGNKGDKDNKDSDKKKNKEQNKQKDKDEKSSKQDEQKKKQSQEQKKSKKQDKDNQKQKVGKKKEKNNKKVNKVQKREAIEKKLADKKIDKILNKEKMLRLKKSKQKGEVPVGGKYW